MGQAGSRDGNEAEYTQNIGRKTLRDELEDLNIDDRNLKK
jgi:hypothetical protein